MEKFGWWLATAMSISFVAGLNLTALADDTPDPDKIKPMFKDGEYKCSDGYDPDTDASLHPPNQNPRTRAFVNAQAQQSHEEKISGQAAKSPEAEKEGGASSSKSKGIGETEIKVDEKEKDKKAEDKDKEKKAEADKDKDKEKADKEKADKEKEAAAKQPDKDANNPLNQALFAIQTKKYQNSVDLLKNVIAKDGKNAQAHYLLAVSYVGLRKYPEASEQYNIVLKLAAANPAANSKLSQLADQGLKRISSSAK